MANRDEYFAHTDPQDSNSLLRLTQLQLTSGWYALHWSAVGGTRYRLEYSATLTPPDFQPVPRPLAEEVDASAYGTDSTQSFLDVFAPPETNAMRLYRIRVLNE